MANAYRVSVIAEDAQRRRLSQQWLRELTKSVLSAESVAPRRRIEVLLSGDETIRQLNADHRSEDSVTDVLSFPAGPAGNESEYDGFPRSPGGWTDVGQIAISIPQAERQARELGHGLKDEVAHLVVHGILHLLGYDHEDSSDETVMRNRERSLLSAAAGIEVHGLHDQPSGHAPSHAVGVGGTSR